MEAIFRLCFKGLRRICNTYQSLKCLAVLFPSLSVLSEKDAWTCINRLPEYASPVTSRTIEIQPKSQREFLLCNRFDQYEEQRYAQGEWKLLANSQPRSCTIVVIESQIFRRILFPCKPLPDFSPSFSFSPLYIAFAIPNTYERLERP